MRREKEFRTDREVPTLGMALLLARNWGAKQPNH